MLPVARSVLVRAVRRAPTPTEALLWQAFKGSRMGVPFRMQFPVGRYIADFCAPRARLIVEADGGYHARRTGPDARRDRQLQRLGYRILRLPAALVQHQFAEALARVHAALAAAP